MAMSVAQALVVANVAATERGRDPSESLVTISEDLGETGRIWRIQYGPRDYIARRGGDLIVLVDEKTGTIQQVLRGQ
jgi:hypothetical protein